MLEPIRPQSDLPKPRISAVEHSGRVDDRPKREPNRNKEFRKVMERDDDSDKEDPADEVAERSIFDLSRRSTPQSGMLEGRAGLTSMEAHGDLSGPTGSKKERGSKSTSSTYAEAHGDLSTVNPMGPTAMASVNAIDVEAGGAGEASKSLTVQQIVDQIVDKIYTLKSNGQTETTLALKNPPLLAGSEIVITGFDSARGEFNIAMHNLTQAGQIFLEQNNIKLGLKQALEEKGYTIHILVTTTEPYSRTLASDGTESTRRDQQRDPNEEGEGKGGGQKNRR